MLDTSDYYIKLNTLLDADVFTNPDMVGQSEYRAIVDLLGDAIDGNEDVGPAADAEFMIGVLDELIRNAQVLREELNRIARGA